MTNIRIPVRIKETLQTSGFKFSFDRTERDMIDIKLDGRWVAKLMNTTSHSPSFVTSICQRIQKKARELRMETAKAGQVTHG